MTTDRVAGRGPSTRAVRRRGWLEVRWRQFRNAPRPGRPGRRSSLLVVAIVLGLGYLAYDVALERGAAPAGRRSAGAQRSSVFVALVLTVGATVT